MTSKNYAEMSQCDWQEEKLTRLIVLVRGPMSVRSAARGGRYGNGEERATVRAYVTIEWFVSPAAAWFWRRQDGTGKDEKRHS